MTEKKFLNPRGTSDILPQDIPRWRTLETRAHKILENFGYKEIRTPFFEETALFARSLGTTSDVVQKQMLNLINNRPDKDKYNDKEDPNEGLSLRPEGTASIVRAYIQNSFERKEGLTKVYYMGAMFRGERPQKGRLRQFHQIGIEAIGPDTSIPFLDAEVIALASQLLNTFGLSGYILKINSLGTKEDKQNFASFLRDHLRKDLSKLCSDCQDRFERNVFRILDCKNESCRKIVSQLPLDGQHLSPESQKYFAQVKEALNLLNTPFQVSPFLVRGLDYYTHTVFEITHPGLGSQDAVGAGGRYNGLVAELGGDSKGNIGAMGFALGMERILLAQNKDNEPRESNHLDAFIVYLDKEGQNEAHLAAFKLLHNLRLNEISCEMNYAKASMKSQMRLADKLGARKVIIIGEDELKENTLTVKDMAAGEQKKINAKDILKEWESF